MFKTCARHVSLIGVFFLALCGQRPAWAENPALIKENHQQFLLTYVVDVKNQSEIPQEFSVIVPYYESDDIQTVEYRDFPGELRQMANSNSKYIESIVTLGSKEQKTLRYEAVITVSDITTDFSMIKAHPYDTESALYKRYTAADLPEIDPHHPTIKEISAKLSAQAGDDLMEYARLVNLHVGSYRYSGGNRHYTMAQVVENRAGSCGGLGGLQASLLRCHGIPARTVQGTQNNGRLHARTEFYLEGYGWFPAEGVSDKFFGRINYEEFSGIFSSQKTAFFQLEGDEHGFLRTKPQLGLLPFSVYAGANVSTKTSSGFVKLENGEPMGKFIPILNH